MELKRIFMIRNQNKPWWMAGGIRPIAVYQPMGATSLANSYINLANPGTYNATLGIAPSFSRTLGWTFAANAYLKTGIIPATGYSMIIRFRDATTNIALAGEINANGNFQINPHQATNNAILYGSGGQLTINNAGLSAGVLAVAGNKAYRNGVVEAGTISAWSASAYEIYIGGVNNNGTHTSKYTGSIEAVVIWDRTLTAAQVAAITTKLLALTDISRVVYDGDSLTLGTGADAGFDYPSQVTTLLGYRYEKQNLGVGGATLANMLSDAVSQVDALYKADRTKNFAVCWGGFNDLNSARAATDIYTDITTYVTGRKAAGYKVIVGTVLPSSSLTGSKETQRVALNALILTNSAGADGVVDLNTATELQTPADTTYFADGTNLTNAGYAIAAQLFKEEILYGGFSFGWLSDIHFGLDAVGYEYPAGALDAIFAEVNTLNPAFVVATGDIAHHGYAAEYDSYIADKATLTMPCYTVPGNHDGAQYEAKGLTDHFVVDYGEYRLIAFRSVSYVDSPSYTGQVTAGELAWLETQLQGASGRRIICMSHYPMEWGRGIVSGHGYEDVTTLFAQYGVILYLSGHNNYPCWTKRVGATLHIAGGATHKSDAGGENGGMMVIHCHSRHIGVDYRSARSPFAAYGTGSTPVYTPIVVTL